MDVIIKNGVTIINMGTEEKTNNKYGVNGVSIYNGMYKVEIQFNKTKYYLGVVKNIEEAKTLREEAESRIENNTFDSWFKNIHQPKNKHGVKGLDYREHLDIYYLNITYNNKKYYIGRYKTVEEAAEIRSIADRKIENGSFLEWLDEYKNNRKK